jgi:hypothetical protein
MAEVLGLPKEPLFALAHRRRVYFWGTPCDAAPPQDQDQTWQEFACNEALLVLASVVDRLGLGHGVHGIARHVLRYKKSLWV